MDRRPMRGAPIPAFDKTLPKLCGRVSCVRCKKGILFIKSIWYVWLLPQFYFLSKPLSSVRVGRENQDHPSRLFGQFFRGPHAGAKRRPPFLQSSLSAFTASLRSIHNQIHLPRPCHVPCASTGRYAIPVGLPRRPQS